MKFTETDLAGAYLVDIEPVEDQRGFFARSWCRKEFAGHGLVAELAQCGISYNPVKGTLRGMHYQDQPYPEAKVVRCTQGAIYDVIIDLRPQSPSFKKWFSVELSSGNRRMLYVPPGFAHGFLTLAPASEVFYQISEYFRAEFSRGVRWNDPAFGVAWPEHPALISERDRQYPDYHA